MKQLADLAKKVTRQQQWSWCRRPNGFCDLPKWRLVASRLNMPAYQVIAFANRLEELANDAGNRGYARGEVTHFNAEEFAVALGMNANDAARIFVALEDSDIGWVADGHVADFYDRNRDKEDDTAPLRMRRLRARRTILDLLARLARLGLVDGATRTEIEVRTRLIGDQELFSLKSELALALSTQSTVTRNSRRNGVTVTPEKSTQILREAVDNFGDKASGSAEGLSERQQPDDAVTNPHAEAELWLATEGTRIVTEKMMETRTLASTRVTRWKDQQLGGDAVALADIIRAVDRLNYVGARFHNQVVDEIRRAPIRTAPQQELKLPPVPVSERKLA
jgi:hypothetical protein